MFNIVFLLDKSVFNEPSWKFMKFCLNSSSLTKERTSFDISYLLSCLPIFIEDTYSNTLSTGTKDLKFVDKLINKIINNHIGLVCIVCSLIKGYLPELSFENMSNNSSVNFEH